MKTYKNIALATDFSKKSINAYHYALHLATELDAALTIVHAFDVPINPIIPDYLSSVPHITELERTSLDRLSHFVNADMPHEGNTLVRSKTKMKTKVKIEVLMGLADAALIEYSKNVTTDLLILGTSIGGDWMDRLMGSTAINVMHGAHCPVLLVPDSVDYNGFAHILYTVSLDSSSNRDVDSMIDFAYPFKSVIHYVHVKEGSETMELSKNLKQLLVANVTHSPVFIENISAETVAEGINAYCLQNPIDLIVTVKQQRPFWDALVHYSISKELGWQTHLPILCLHSDDK